MREERGESPVELLPVNPIGSAGDGVGRLAQGKKILA